jgi:hypothetical protein
MCKFNWIYISKGEWWSPPKRWREGNLLFSHWNLWSWKCKPLSTGEDFVLAFAIEIFVCSIYAVRMVIFALKTVGFTAFGRRIWL